MMIKSKVKMQKSKLQLKSQKNKKLMSFGLHFCLLIIGVLSLPYSVLASNVYIDTGHPDFFVGDTIMFSVRVDSENKNINAAEGSVILDYLTESVSLIDINTAGAKFSLWPQKPLPSENNTSISFVGGSPGGFNSKDAVIFNLVLKLQKVGQITLSPDNFSVYLNDGQGTKDEISVKNLVIDVLPKKPDSQSVDDWNNVTLNDKTPPEPFEITPGQDPSIFDNQYFISFFTTDAASGIAYYEVQEGERDFIRAESPYLLQNQSLKNLIKVKAIDKAGNERMEELLSPAPTVLFYKNILFWIVIFIIIIVILYVFCTNFKRKIKI